MDNTKLIANLYQNNQSFRNGVNELISAHLNELKNQVKLIESVNSEVVETEPKQTKSKVADQLNRLKNSPTTSQSNTHTNEFTHTDAIKQVLANGGMMLNDIREHLAAIGHEIGPKVLTATLSELIRKGKVVNEGNHGHKTYFLTE